MIPPSSSTVPSAPVWEEVGEVPKFNLVEASRMVGGPPPFDSTFYIGKSLGDWVVVEDGGEDGTETTPCASLLHGRGMVEGTWTRRQAFLAGIAGTPKPPSPAGV